MKRSVDELPIGSGAGSGATRPLAEGRRASTAAAGGGALLRVSAPAGRIAGLDRAQLEEFTEFLRGEGRGRPHGPLPADPAFRERLRRRLWRAFGLRRLRGLHEVH